METKILLKGDESTKYFRGKKYLITPFIGAQFELSYPVIGIGLDFAKEDTNLFYEYKMAFPIPEYTIHRAWRAMKIIEKIDMMDLDSLFYAFALAGRKASMSAVDEYLKILSNGNTSREALRDYHKRLMKRFMSISSFQVVLRELENQGSNIHVNHLN